MDESTVKKSAGILASKLGTFGFLPPLPGVGATRRQATSITSEKADIAGLDETLV